MGDRTQPTFLRSLIKQITLKLGMVEVAQKHCSQTARFPALLQKSSIGVKAHVVRCDTCEKAKQRNDH